MCLLFPAAFRSRVPVSPTRAGVGRVLRSQVRFSVSRLSSLILMLLRVSHGGRTSCRSRDCVLCISNVVWWHPWHHTPWPLLTAQYSRSCGSRSSSASSSVMFDSGGCPGRRRKHQVLVCRNCVAVVVPGCRWLGFVDWHTHLQCQVAGLALVARVPCTFSGMQTFQRGSAAPPFKCVVRTFSVVPTRWVPLQLPSSHQKSERDCDRGRLPLPPRKVFRTMFAIVASSSSAIFCNCASASPSTRRLGV